MKDKWLVTLEIDTYDGNPAKWDWKAIFTGDDDIEIQFLKANTRVEYYPLVKVWKDEGDSVMNKEYLRAKVDLCLDQAEKDLQQEEIARAIKNLQRANSALTRIFNMEEDQE
jgi:hypothetical protein